MTAAYRIYSKPCIHTYIFPNMATNNILNISTKLHYASITQIQSIFLQNIINYSTCTNVKRILICSSVRSACTWKIVLKTQNNELNEFSECMLYKMFCFFGKHLKTVKLSFTEYFPEALLAYFNVSKTFCTCLLLKVYKTFNTCLLACFALLFFKSL